MSWSEVALGDVCALITDGTHQSPSSSPSGDYLYLTSKNVRPWGLDLANVSYVSSSDHEEIYRGCPVQYGDVLFVKDGANTGNVTLNSLREPFSLLSSVALIRTRPTVLAPPFLKWWLSSPTALRRMTRRMSGTAIRRIVLRELKGSLIPLPPIEEQRRIAAILDKADAIRRKRQEAIELTDQLLRSTFLEMASEGHPDYSTWDTVPVAELAEPRKNSIRSGPFGSALRHAEFVASGVAVLGIDNAVNNRFAWGERRFITAEKYAQLERYTVFPGDVIVTIMGTTGRTAVVPQGLPTAITTKHLATITVDSGKATPQYLAHALRLDPMVERALRSQSRGAVMPGLNLGIIRKLQLRVPPIKQQRRYARAVSQLETLRAGLLAAAQSTETLFASLQQRAFRGEL